MGCAHSDVSWNGGDATIPDGAECADCGMWWRADLIPSDVLERLPGGAAPREGRRSWSANGTRA
jgi:hypothetical protein